MSSWANSLLNIAQHTTILYSRAPSAHRLQSMSPEVCYILYNKRSSAFWKSAAIFCRVHIWWILIKYDYSLCISCTLLHCPSFPVWFPPTEFFFHRRLFFFFTFKTLFVPPSTTIFNLIFKTLFSAHLRKCMDDVFLTFSKYMKIQILKNYSNKFALLWNKCFKNCKKTALI